MHNTTTEKNTKQQQTALVTGGAGFIGSHLVEALVEKGYTVTVLDSLVKGKLSSIKHLIDAGKVIFIEGDIRNKDSVDKAMKNVEYVFHTAGIHIQKSCESPEDAIDVNIKGSYNIFHSALEHKIKRVIFSSSSSVYGDPKVLPMTEDSEMNIVEPYGASKLMCEHLLQYLGKQGLKYTILRYFNVYGSRQAVHAYYTTVVIHFINRIMNNEQPVIDGKGDQSMDFTHVSDVVRGNILAAECETENEIFNIGTGKSTSVAELATIIIKALGKNITPQFRDREVLVSRRQACTKKAERLLGFRSQVVVEEGMSMVAKEIAEHLEQYK
ncbi:MAG: SDR family NAD(P)-dependent oxidoreductase [Nanoarchaeota archaeon]|nr:SDR family NAD(P)-dependent oxidoreductase [Nanoarchaeota archaeon]